MPDYFPFGTDNSEATRLPLDLPDIDFFEDDLSSRSDEDFLHQESSAQTEDSNEGVTDTEGLSSRDESTVTHTTVSTSPNNSQSPQDLPVQQVNVPVMTFDDIRRNIYNYLHSEDPTLVSVEIRTDDDSSIVAYSIMSGSECTGYTSVEEYDDDDEVNADDRDQCFPDDIYREPDDDDDDEKYYYLPEDLIDSTSVKNMRCDRERKKVKKMKFLSSEECIESHQWKLELWAARRKRFNFQRHLDFVSSYYS